MSAARDDEDTEEALLALERLRHTMGLRRERAEWCLQQIPEGDPAAEVFRDGLRTLDETFAILDEQEAKLRLTRREGVSEPGE